MGTDAPHPCYRTWSAEPDGDAIDALDCAALNAERARRGLDAFPICPACADPFQLETVTVGPRALLVLRTDADLRHSHLGRLSDLIRHAYGPDVVVVAMNADEDIEALSGDDRERLLRRLTA